MIRRLEKSDIPGLNALTPVEWKFNYEDFLYEFITEDYFFAFVMILEGKIIGTGNVIVKDKIGWLGNIIIDVAFRGQGLGYKMTKYLVDFLEGKGCETQLLIATKLGESIYRKIGFKKISAYQCFDSEIDTNFALTGSIRKLQFSDLDSLYRMDEDANAENRKHFMKKYYKTGWGYFDQAGVMVGFYLPDFGRGLIISRDPQVGIELLKLKHSKAGKRTLLPIENKEGTYFLEQNGYRKGDTCSRMILGKTIDWRPEYIFSYGSGYCG